MKSSITPKKHLGQHFLHDDHYCRKIVSSLEIGLDDHIVEIGPGTGALTRFLYPQLKDRYTGIEIDPRAVSELKNQFGPEINLIGQDFMKLEPEAWLPEIGMVKVVGNLPYYITSPILFKLLDVVSRLELTVIMIQKEVAERIAASPGGKDYGILSVRFQQAARIQMVTRVPPGAFFPPPTVDSAVLVFHWYKNPPLKPLSINDFEKIVRQAFHARRKTLRNNLNALFNKNLPAIIDWNRRAETLSVEEFVTLSDLYTQTKNPGGL